MDPTSLLVGGRVGKCSKLSGTGHHLDFCCWPLGIVAVIFAAQVNGKVASGDIAGANDASKKAKLFSYISIGIGLVVGVIYLLLTILGIGLGAMQN